MRTIQNVKAIVFDQKEIANPITRSFLSLGDKMHLGYSEERDVSGICDSLRSRGYDSKEVLILTGFKGRFFQLCPGSPGMICCRYLVLNTCFNCLYNCSYCYLNSYLNSFGIVQFTNFGKALEEIDEFRRKMDPNRIYRIGTGEFTDSLMMDEITGIGKRLIHHTSTMSNIMIELKTKSHNIDHLLDIPDKGNAVLAWSLNTERNIERYEENTSCLDERINAARKAVQSGYYTAFHFDPIIVYTGWKDDYLNLLARLFDEVDPEKIAWISLGCFRYSPGFKDCIRDKFPREDLTSGEMFPGSDGKVRYIKSKRREIYKTMVSYIKERAGRTVVYLCMESADVWEDVFGRRYESSEMLERDISDRLKFIIK